MLGDETLLDEKDVPANSFHSRNRAFVCTVSWENQELKHNLNWNLSTWCLSNPPAPLNVGLAHREQLASCRNCEILVLNTIVLWGCLFVFK